MVFSRLLNTSDPRDHGISSTPLYLLWGMHALQMVAKISINSNTLFAALSDSSASPPASAGADWAFGQHDTQGTTGPVNFLVGGALPDIAPPYEKLRKAHGILMILAWAFCAVTGAFVARYLKAQMAGAWL